ncbi:MAG: TrmJ/YjtD family RNA methyltransferase [Acidobacteria bacterium]|nr:TrmJ/YjtD family RNA methyltransferase [Acidobacteriota bacterium]
MTSLRVVLVSPRNPLNIGAAARAMSNFGFIELRLVNPYQVAFREAKSAVGAGAVLKAASEFATVAEAVADCTLVVGTTAGSHREPRQPLYGLEYGARRIRKHQGPVALLFGSEKYGLSNDNLSHCQWLIEIRSRPQHRSMNLGQAVAVCLYELVRDRRAAIAKPPARKPATAEQTEVLRERIEEALKLSGYYDHTAVAGAQRRLRALVKRLNLSRDDAAVWLGILRQIVWKLRSGS